jgi:hypothetical protein
MFLITVSFSVFSQEQRNNFIVFPVRNHTFLWSFPNYWIGDREFANSIGEAAIFYLNGYELQESIALFGIGFGDNAASISIDNFAVRNMNRWINNVRNTYQINYSSEKVNWDIIRDDNSKIVIYRLYSNDNPMHQYCAIIQSNMPNYIIAYIQLNIDHEINELFINDFKTFLENVIIVEESFEATDESVEELRSLLEGSEVRRGF